MTPVVSSVRVAPQGGQNGNACDIAVAYFKGGGRKERGACCVLDGCRRGLDKWVVEYALLPDSGRDRAGC
jgi:hypothetical protein